MSARSLQRSLVLIAAASAFSCARPGVAQSQPDRPITLVVPFAPGGGTDSIARDLAREMSERLGQSVIVDNRGGDGGAIAATALTRAAPDGQTLLLVTSTFVTHAASDPAVRYDIARDFTPLAQIGRGPLLVVASRQSGIRGIADLIARARAAPGTLNFCSAGPGSINHLAGEWFSRKTGIAMTHIPYKGSAPATVDLIAGRTQVFFATVPTILPHVRDSRVELLAVTSRTRSTLFPDTPTVAEAGVDFETATWWGVVAPPALPTTVRDRLQRAATDAATSPRIRARLQGEGAEPVPAGGIEFARMMAAELEAWRAVVRQAGLKL
jgi:tripartite-type tricarboxylate transporter receptor subunit TctC